jgi:hypothetical protein
MQRWRTILVLTNDQELLKSYALDDQGRHTGTITRQPKRNLRRLMIADALCDFSRDKGGVAEAAALESLPCPAPDEMRDLTSISWLLNHSERALSTG